MPAPRGSGAYVSIRLCVVYVSFVSSVREFFCARFFWYTDFVRDFFSTRTSYAELFFVWYADSRTRSYSLGAPYGATRFLRCFTASRSRLASGDRVAPQGAHKNSPCAQPVYSSEFSVCVSPCSYQDFPCASARVLKSFFILHS